MTILAVYREPFGFEPRVQHLPEGLTLADLAARMPGLPHDFDARGVICVNGRAVVRSAWPLIRPKPMHNGVPVEVTFHARPMGGGDDGKSIFALVASIALTALSGGILGGSFATAGGFFARGTLSAAFLASGVSLAGSLLVSALSAPPIEERRQRGRPNEGAASVQGNVIDPNGAIPRVIGERKVFPPLACEPLTYFDGPDEIVEAVYCLAGPHRLQVVQVGGAALDSLGVEYETREGWPGDARLRLVRRQGRTESLQAELRGHLVLDDDGRTLDVTSGDIVAALPRPTIVVTRDAPDVHWLHLVFPQGLHLRASDTDRMRVPLRLRMRQKGAATWINLPELHFQAANIRQLRATIELVWTDAAVATPDAANTEGFVEARRFSPGQTAEPAQPDWAADPYFGASGPVFMSAANLGSTGVEHVELDRFTARILLDTAVFPRGRYEIEVLRGAAFQAADYAAATYQVSGSVWDLFGFRGVPRRIVRSRDGVADAAYLLRSVSVWNDHPVPTDELALIAVRARNRQLDALSCVAGGWVRDWDGVAWRAWAVTGNPAPHLRDIYAGALNARPVPGDMVDDDALVAWRTDCATRALTCHHVTEDQSMLDVANIVASCGFGRPYMSDVWGVVRDYDRSAEAPVQIFTPRNSRGFSFSRALPDLPDGFRVNFRDATRDYEARQITVARPGFAGVPRVTEQVDYQGIVTEEAAAARAVYDLRQPELRGTFYSLEAPAEAIVCRRGDLVGVTHDTLTQRMGAGRIIDRQFDGAGDVIALTLDAEVETVGEPDLLAVTNLLAVPDVLALGLGSAVIVRGPAGPSAAVGLTNGTGRSAQIALAAGIDPADAPEGALVAVGLAGRETRRLIVYAIEPREDLAASLTLVDEAADLWPRGALPVLFDGAPVTFDGADVVFTAG